jgi:cytochrome o ubiquinol oxidase subunit 1
MAGVLLSLPAADYQLHNSLFLVAHFHTMIVSGALFGIFAGITYWFPKVTGFTLNEKWGKRAFWAWLFGFLLSFGPLYVLGFLGATRRLDHYDIASWRWLFVTAGIGLCVIGIGALCQIIQFIVSIRDRKKNLDTTGDPWNGRTLEWSVPSPAPFYNFAILPKVEGRDAWWEVKKNNTQYPIPNIQYQDIHMPKNTAMGIYLSGFVFLLGFAFVWHITWLIIVSLIASIVCVIIKSLEEETEYTITAAELERMEKNSQYPISNSQ